MPWIHRAINNLGLIKILVATLRNPSNATLNWLEFNRPNNPYKTNSQLAARTLWKFLQKQLINLSCHSGKPLSLYLSYEHTIFNLPLWFLVGMERWLVYELSRLKLNQKYSNVQWKRCFMVKTSGWLLAHYVYMALEMGVNRIVTVLKRWKLSKTSKTILIKVKRSETNKESDLFPKLGRPNVTQSSLRHYIWIYLFFVILKMLFDVDIAFGLTVSMPIGTMLWMMDLVWMMHLMLMMYFMLMMVVIVVMIMLRKLHIMLAGLVMIGMVSMT